MAARLHHPILFCSDINLKTLIDITPFDEEHLLITCKSFVKRFSITDRKQVNSWITKSWDPFTCGAVKNPDTNKIYAVVNQTVLYHWPVEEKDVQNFKKCHFKSGIHSLVSHNDTLFIIYSSGYIELLENGLDGRKIEKPRLLKENENIIQYHIYSPKNETRLLVKSKAGDIMLYRIKISSSDFSYSSIKLKDYQLTGSIFLSYGNLLTTWSDGNLYNKNSFPKSGNSDPGNKIVKLNPIKENRKVKILHLSEHHLAFQGMNSNEEGGMLVLFDAKFGVPVSTKPLKMYRDPPLAWNIPSGIVVGDGGSLVYVPVSLSPSTVVSMLGSRKVENITDICLGWRDSNRGDSGTVQEIPFGAIQTILSNKSQQLSKIIVDLKLGSVSEDVIVDAVVSKIISQKDLDLLTEAISSFSFISEKCLVRMLKFLIEFPEDPENEKGKTKPNSKDVSKKTNAMPNGFGDDSNESLSTEMDVDRDDEDQTQSKEVPFCLFSKRKCAIINKILRKPISVDQVMKEIKILDFSNSIKLVKYLHYLLASGNAQLFNYKSNEEVPTVENICKWLSILFDANYQQLLITADVDLYRIHMEIFSYTKSILKFWQSSSNVEVLVKGIISSDLMLPIKPVDRPYSIEKIIL